jgi:hypothetical protein
MQPKTVVDTLIQNTTQYSIAFDQKYVVASGFFGRNRRSQTGGAASYNNKAAFYGSLHFTGHRQRLLF